MCPPILMTKKLYILTLIAAISLVLGLVSAAESSKFDIKIVLEKDEYTVGETLEGKIEITNRYPATLPLTFTMEMTHNGVKKRNSQTFVKTFPFGSMNFSLKTFGIPQQPFEAYYVGTWEIIINKLKAEDKYAGRAKFEVKETK